MLWTRHASTAIRGGTGLSAGELLGEPDDQVVVQAYLDAFAERMLALACTPAVGDTGASSVHPLRWAVLVEQADGAQRRDAPVNGSLLGRIHPPTPRLYPKPPSGSPAASSSPVSSRARNSSAVLPMEMSPGWTR